MDKKELKKALANVKYFLVDIDMVGTGYIGIVGDADTPYHYAYYTTPLMKTKELAHKRARVWLKKEYPNNMKMFSIRVHPEKGYIAIVKSTDDKILFTSEPYDTPEKANTAAEKHMRKVAPEYIAIVSTTRY